MKIVWDEEKRLNLDKHGCDFADLVHFDWDHAAFVDDERKNYGERRVLAFGLLKGRLHVLAFTPRKDAVRIISFRRANRREVKRHGNS